MISDKLSNIKRYFGMNNNLDKALKFLQGTNLSSLPSGKTIICEDRVFINHFVYETSSTLGNFENHKQHLDMHITLKGCEKILLAPVELMSENSYDKDGDIQDLNGKASSEIVIHPGEFVLVFPGEAHIPKVAYQQPQEVDKFVVKILFELGCIR